MTYTRENNVFLTEQEGEELENLHNCIIHSERISSEMIEDIFKFPQVSEEDFIKEFFKSKDKDFYVYSKSTGIIRWKNEDSDFYRELFENKHHITFLTNMKLYIFSDFIIIFYFDEDDCIWIADIKNRDEFKNHLLTTITLINVFEKLISTGKEVVLEELNNVNTA